MLVSVRKAMLVAGILQNLARHRLCLGSVCWTYEARALRSRINASFSASKYEIRCGFPPDEVAFCMPFSRCTILMNATR